MIIRDSGARGIRRGEGPEMVGVAVGIAGGGDAHASVEAGDALGFAEVVAELFINRMFDAAIFEKLEELGGRRLGKPPRWGARAWPALSGTEQLKFASAARMLSTLSFTAVVVGVSGVGADKRGWVRLG